MEQITTQTFIDGLRDPDTQQALRLARNRTLADALSHALEFETAKQASRMHVRVRHIDVKEPAKSPEPKPLADEIAQALEKFFSGTKIDAAGGRAERRPGRGQPTCWSCGKKGHLSRDCKERREPNPSSGDQPFGRHQGNEY